MPSDWLAAVLAANQNACLKSVLVNNDFLITISDSKPDPRLITIRDILETLSDDRILYMVPVGWSFVFAR